MISVEPDSYNGVATDTPPETRSGIESQALPAGQARQRHVRMLSPLNNSGARTPYRTNATEASERYQREAQVPFGATRPPTNQRTSITQFRFGCDTHVTLSRNSSAFLPSSGPLDPPPLKLTRSPSCSRIGSPASSTNSTAFSSSCHLARSSGHTRSTGSPCSSRSTHESVILIVPVISASPPPADSATASGPHWGLRAAPAPSSVPPQEAITGRSPRLRATPSRQLASAPEPRPLFITLLLGLDPGANCCGSAATGDSYPEGLIISIPRASS
jgi:hypothetical protein